MLFCAVFNTGGNLINTHRSTQNRQKRKSRCIVGWKTFYQNHFNLLPNTFGYLLWKQKTKKKW